MIVVDTNIISYLFLPNDTFGQKAEALFSKDKNWLSPALWYYEFFNVLTIYLRQSVIDVQYFTRALSSSMDIVKTEKIIDQNLLITIVQSSLLSGYDCQYIALASEMNLPLITEDKKIIKEFPDIAMSMGTFLNNL